MTKTEGLGTTEAPSKDAPRFEGVVLDRLDPEFLARAFDVYADLRAIGPVVRAAHHHFAGDNEDAARGTIKDVLFVSHYDEAAAALVDDRISSDPNVLATPEQRAKMQNIPTTFRPLVHSLILMDPPDHTRLRRLVQPAFNARAMEALKPRVQRIADELLDKAEREAATRGETTPERQMELIKAFAYPLPVTVISDMLGIPEEDRAIAQQLVELRFDNDPVEMMRRNARLTEFTNYLMTLFERKRREPGDDMITQMVHAQEEGDKLSNEELLSMVFILYLAGHVTTVNLIGNGVAALLTHPEQLAIFKSDPSLSKGVVEETLRYWGPIDFLAGVTLRTAKEDIELGGVEVLKGAQLAVALGAANRDPQQFANPEKYDITRTDAHRHVAFGKGIHLCLGAPLARIEGQIAFETLFRRMPELRLAIPPAELRWRAGLRGFRELPVLF